MDHEELLRKFIRHVYYSQRSTLVEDWVRDHTARHVKFTDEEWAEVQRLEEQAFEQDRRPRRKPSREDEEGEEWRKA